MMSKSLSCNFEKAADAAAKGETSVTITNSDAPHGAGRVMGRREAKDRLKMEDFKESMKGIWSSTVCTGTLDEAPMAYKSMSEIISNIEPTAEVEKIIKPVFNFKAAW